MRLRVVAAGIAAIFCIASPAGAQPTEPAPTEPTLLLTDSAASSRHSTVLREAAISGAAIGVGFLLDDTIEPGSGQGTFVDKAGNALGSAWVLGGGTAVIALDGWVGHDEGKLGLAKDLALALAATSATVATLKYATHRERPDGSDDRSFPSGHSANTFAVATVIDRRYGGIAGWIGYGAALFVASSRVIGDHHWFSDVVAGAAIGRFYGRLVTMEP